jgi:hypothetical protein
VVGVFVTLVTRIIRMCRVICLAGHLGNCSRVTWVTRIIRMCRVICLAGHLGNCSRVTWVTRITRMCRFIWQDIWETAGVLHGLLGLLGCVGLSGRTSGKLQSCCMGY